MRERDLNGRILPLGNTMKIIFSIIFASVLLVTTQLPAESSNFVRKIVLEYKVLKPSDVNSSAVVSLDASGRGNIDDFPNDAGKLEVEFKDGKARLDTNGDGMINDKDDPAFVPIDMYSVRIIKDKDDLTAVHNDKIVNLKCKTSWGQDNCPVCVMTDSQVKDSREIYIRSLTSLQGRFDNFKLAIIPSFYWICYPRCDWLGLKIRPRNIALLGPDDEKDLEGCMGLEDWKPVILLDGKLLCLDLAADGSFITVRSYEGPVARVTVKSDVRLFGNVRFSENDKLRGVDLKPGREYSLIPGKYRMSLQIGSDEQNCLSALTKDDGPVTFTEGSNTLKVGPPVKISFDYERNGNEVILKQLDICGVGGECYQLNREYNPDEVAEWFVRSGDRKIVGKLEYGWGGFNRSSVRVPENFPKDAEVVVRVKSKLLGKAELSKKLSGAHSQVEKP